MSTIIEFGSVPIRKKLNLEHFVYFKSNIAEVFRFKFGFVMPETENSWDNIVEVKDPLPVSVLSGNVVLETRFKDGEDELLVSRMKIVYV